MSAATTSPTRSTLSRRTWCIGCLLGAGLAGRRVLAADALEGRRFDTQAGMAGKPGHVPSDILSFAGGLFHSSDCDQYAYGKGRYTTRVESDGSIRFEARTESPTYGHNVWSGRVRGRSIEGEFVFHRKPTFWRPSPDPLPHWFKGHEVGADGKPLA
jgi:hypothetical protein